MAQTIYLVTTAIRAPRRVLAQDRYCAQHWAERQGQSGWASSRTKEVTVRELPDSNEECDECEYDARLARMGG